LKSNTLKRSDENDNADEGSRIECLDVLEEILEEILEEFMCRTISRK